MTRAGLDVRMFFTVLTLCMVPGVAAAEDLVPEDELDVTMIMVTDDALLTESVVRQIELPEPLRNQVPEKAAQSAQSGLNRANQAREGARGLGERMAEQAQGLRDSAAAKRGLEIATEARDRAESRRPERPDLPARPDVPEVPEMPEAPEVPERPAPPDLPEVPELPSSR